MPLFYHKYVNYVLAHSVNYVITLYTKEGSKQVELATRVYEDTATNTQPDGNNVDVDSQSNELAKVQLHYQALKNQMNGEFTRLRSAMKT